jgi:hypothetical protein
VLTPRPSAGRRGFTMAPRDVTMTLRTFRYPPGTRVELVRGSFPMDPSLVGRSGLVVETDEYRPGRYGVQVDGEAEVRDLLEEELVPVEG